MAAGRSESSASATGDRSAQEAGLPRAWSSYSKVGESARYAIRLRTSAMDLQTHRASDPRRAQASGIDSDAVAGAQGNQGAQPKNRTARVGGRSPKGGGTAPSGMAAKHSCRATGGG